MALKMKNIGAESRRMTVKEVADYLRIHPSTVYRQVKRGGFPAFKVGSQSMLLGQWADTLHAEKRNAKKLW